MKIKIIDLLNKVANGDVVPKIIMFNNIRYDYQEEDNTYYSYGNNCLWKGYCFGILNDYVEIIEEEKELEKLDIESENGRYRLKFNSCSYSLNEINYIILSKLNEVIDTLNKMKVDD